MLKIKFFTNVSHEFRTPLTLILTPVERLMKHSRDPGEKGQLQLVHRNARRLLNLVNQLLDFRKMEVQEIKLNPTVGDIVQFSRDVAYSFSDLSEKKHIGFSFNSQVQHLETMFDHNKLERILFNLISNAFKFTGDGGKVAVDMSLLPQNGTQLLKISVSDTGIGIAPEEKDQIFERFFQSDTPGSMVNQGSGIGLSIAREFVRLHGGKISVESEQEKGSCFTVLLPVKEIGFEVSGQTTIEKQLKVQEPATRMAAQPQRGKKKPVLLLVEDNEDFRFYLKDNLAIRYQVLEAGNGKEGWALASEQIPDLIVSDVMMPEMNGVELCRKIRGDGRTGHNPVIHLSFRVADDKVKEGFGTGTDHYVTMPFSFEILQSRIRNLLERHASVRQALGNKIEIKASEIKI